jgi:ABC-2 type transport system permease protein
VGRRGRLQRDRLAGWLAVIAPPVLLERAFQALARTDLLASLAYEARVRAFRAVLRGYHHPERFLDQRFEPAALEALPKFDAQGAVQRPVPP